MGVPADSLAASVHEGGHGGAHRLIPLLRGGLDPAAQDSLQGCVLGPNLDWTALDTAYSVLQAGPHPWTHSQHLAAGPQQKRWKCSKIQNSSTLGKLCTCLLPPARHPPPDVVVQTE